MSFETFGRAPVRTIDRPETRKLNALEWSTSGELLALADDGRKSNSTEAENVIRTYVLTPTGTKNASMIRGHSDTVLTVCWGSHHPSFLGSASSDNTVRLWDLRARRNVGVIPIRGRPWSMTLSPDGRQGAFVADDGSVSVFDVGSRKIMVSSKWGDVCRGDEEFDTAATGEMRSAGDVSATTIRWLPSGALVVGSVHRGETHEGRLEWMYMEGDAFARRTWASVHACSIRTVASDTEGRLVATAGRDGSISVLDALSGEPLSKIDADGVGVLDIAISRDSAAIAYAAEEGTASVTSPTGKAPHIPLRDAKYASNVAFSPKHPLLAWGPVLPTSTDPRAPPSIGIHIAVPSDYTPK